MIIRSVPHYLQESVRPGRVQKLMDLGFSLRQARFLVHVLVFSGVFIERQYRAFAGIAHGQKTHDFLGKLVTGGYATAVTPGALHRGRLYHVQYKPLYEAIGEPNNRNRKRSSLGRSVERLMLLDAVLADTRYGWLGTEQDKRNYFHAALEEDLLPRWYPHLRFGEGAACTVRFFPDKLPIGVPLKSERRHVFLYLATRDVPADFRLFADLSTAVLQGRHRRNRMKSGHLTIRPRAASETFLGRLRGPLLGWAACSAAATLQRQVLRQAPSRRAAETHRVSQARPLICETVGPKPVNRCTQIGEDRDFRVFLLQHANLLTAIHDWTIRVLLPRRFRKSAALYRYAVRDAFMTRLTPREVEQLDWYFRGRQGQVIGPSPWRDLDITTAARAFGAARFEALYRAWQQRGDDALHTMQTPFLQEQLQRGTGRIEFAELPHQYLQLTPLVGRSYEVEKTPGEGDNLATA